MLKQPSQGNECHSIYDGSVDIGIRYPLGALVSISRQCYNKGYVLTVFVVHVVNQIRIWYMSKFEKSVLYQFEAVAEA
jgi:hypothetical protein